MDDPRSDANLLCDFLQHDSRDAFGALVNRYAGLVYSAALRQTNDAHLAEDVSQAVFILLSQRARKIKEPTRLVGWLFQTVYFTAGNALRIQRRRRRHERAYAAREPIMFSKPEPDQWDDIAPVLDQAMAKLDRPSRDALLMRYFQQKSVQDVASALGLSVDAAQKRLSRALEKMRGLLLRRGVNVSAAVTTASLLNRSVESVPAALHQTIFAASQPGSAPTPITAQIVNAANRSITLRRLRLVAAACIAILALSQLRLAPIGASPASPTVQMPVFPAADATTEDDERSAVSTWDPSLVNLPIPKPWPMALPGNIAGSAIPADLFGDGTKEIIVPSIGMGVAHQKRFASIVHPHPTLAALVYAFHLDGTTVAGFPVELASVEMRLRGAQKNPKYSDDWWASPSVVKIDGKDVIVIPGPNLKDLWDRALFVIHGDGSMETVRVGSWRPDPNAPIIQTRLQKNGPIELLGAYAQLTDGIIVPSRVQSKLMSGWDVCVGDARGDGELEFYQAAPRPDAFKTGNSVVFGYDHLGHMLPGWPQSVGGQSGMSVVMGDLLGDGKMEIAMPDGHDRLLAWTADGKRFGPTYPDDPVKAKEYEAKRGHPINAVPTKELSTSILKEGLPFGGPLALADLDGDGKPEIVFYCRDHTLRALHGDGTPFANTDGIIATLPPQNDAYGVSIASLDSGVMDFFLGTSWVRRKSDGSTTIIDMLPGAVNRISQPTIADVDSDGLADVLVNTTDGRTFLYHTGKPYHPESIQWATIDGDLNHTACWHKPVSTSPARP